MDALFHAWLALWLVCTPNPNPQVSSLFSIPVFQQLYLPLPPLRSNIIPGDAGVWASRSCVVLRSTLNQSQRRNTKK